LNNFGEKGEILAANYLIANGYKIIEKNYYNSRGYRLGEIDLIGKNSQDEIIFFEVKTRTTKGREVVPEESVTRHKLQKIFKIAHYFLREKDLLEVNWRVDFIGVIFNLKNKKASIRHIKHLYL
jgi:putative endonuclease